MRRPMACLAVLAVAGACAPAARAACSAYPALVYHGLDGTYFACDDRSPVSAFAYQISDPLFTNSGGAPILACEQYDPATCPSPGVVGDGAIRVLADWGQSGFNGCTVTATGPNRIAIVVQAADGQGLVATLSGADPSFGYLVEAAHPFDAATSQVFPLPCTRQGGAPQILADVPRPDGKVNLILHFTPPLVYSDCDPGTVGQAVGTCTDAFQPDVRLGRIFTSQQPCQEKTVPDTLPPTSIVPSQVLGPVCTNQRGNSPPAPLPPRVGPAPGACKACLSV